MFSSPVRRLAGSILGLSLTFAAINAKASPTFPTPTELKVLVEAARSKTEYYAGRYENTVAEGALELATRLSAFYYPGSYHFQPAQMIEQALNRKRSLPSFGSTARARLLDQIQSVELEISSLKRDQEIDHDLERLARTKHRLAMVEPKLAPLKAQLAEVTAADAREVKQTQISKLVRKIKLATTVEAKGLQQELDAAVAELRALGGQPRFDGDVTPGDVARLVAEDRHLPISVVVESGEEKLARVEAELRAEFVGNDHAIKTVMNALARRVRNLDQSRRPLRFLLDGPPGVGRTAFETALTRAWHGAEAPTTTTYLPEPSTSRQYDIDEALRAPARLVRINVFEVDHLAAASDLAPLFDDHPMANLSNMIVTASAYVTGDWSIMRDFHPDAKLESTFGLKAGALADKTEAERTQLVFEAQRSKRNFPKQLVDKFDAVLVFDRITQATLVGLVEKFLREHAAFLLERHDLTLETKGLAEPIARLIYESDKGGIHYRRATQQIIAKGINAFAEPYGGYSAFARVKVTAASADPSATALTFTATLSSGEVKTNRIVVTPAAESIPFLHTGLRLETNLESPKSCEKYFWQ